MNWREVPSPVDDEGNPKFLGVLHLTNDKNEPLAGIVWFYETGPFYARAVDLKEPTVSRRIGPHSTIESAKAACLDVIEGRLDVSKRAGYER